ncbi:hypothetical protein D0809_15000 [Flavobacterium circumlabens]|uniref:Uncharacterized protein n=1 Tax=Flavobacterium circumlabens TaxID=2133765 RepID=A0A4Y7UBS3_9FLAO|nr:hypothetical protein [Flavobacterium circumlabens]TCN56440.1 hypothetical protein EV142_105218 [Flavobacterium circumlabens]TEB43468.1 hypothetical protein D0809_15000 [Flavobacterium circumlabens]
MEQIKQNLEKYFNHHFEIINSFSLNAVINEYITENNNYYLSLGINNYMEDEEVKELTKIKDNQKLINSFLEVKKLNINEAEIIESFKNDIINAIRKLTKIIKKDEKSTIYQSMFIEHDFFPLGYIRIYGKGQFSINKKPSYLNFDYNNELLSEDCKIDYSPVWKEYLKFNSILEELELDNYLLDSTFYESLTQVYIYKVFLLLNKTFQQLESKIFEGINIHRPFYIYGNEHDCEASNIYVFK